MNNKLIEELNTLLRPVSSVSFFSTPPFFIDGVNNPTAGLITFIVQESSLDQISNASYLAQIIFVCSNKYCNDKPIPYQEQMNYFNDINIVLSKKYDVSIDPQPKDKLSDLPTMALQFKVNTQGETE